MHDFLIRRKTLSDGEVKVCVVPKLQQVWSFCRRAVPDGEVKVCVVPKLQHVWSFCRRAVPDGEVKVCVWFQSYSMFGPSVGGRCQTVDRGCQRLAD